MPKWAPEPPVALPPGHVVHVPGRGEMFVRDTGGDGPPVLLLHGWMFSADLNWWRAYGPLERAGYRVLAVDHRGHGRGLRSPESFRLSDCADDCAALLHHLGTGPAIVVGYSMGGAIAQLMAREHADMVAGLVLSATSTHWTDARQKLLWRTLAGVRFGLGMAPDGFWRQALRLLGFPDTAVTTWVTSELTRGSAADLAEAGRELSRFDSRKWVGRIRLPSAVVITTEDSGVPPEHQRELAQRLGTKPLEVRGDHGAVIARAGAYNKVLLRALDNVREPSASLATARG